MLKMSPELGDAPITAPMQGTEPFIWQSASHQIAYIPAGQTHPAHFPSLFNALAQREVAEVYEQDQTFLLNKQTTHHGTLYVAHCMWHATLRLLSSVKTSSLPSLLFWSD